jgi:hypothetical protein
MLTGNPSKILNKGIKQLNESPEIFSVPYSIKLMEDCFIHFHKNGENNV